MIITKLEKLGSMIVVTTDAYPDCLPTFNLQVIANGPQLVDKVLDRLRDIFQNPELPPDDPHVAKFEHMKLELTGLDIGEL